MYFNSLQQLSRGGGFSGWTEEALHTECHSLETEGDDVKPPSFTLPAYMLLKFYIVAIGGHSAAATPPKWPPTVRHCICLFFDWGIECFRDFGNLRKGIVRKAKKNLNSLLINHRFDRKIITRIFLSTMCNRSHHILQLAVLVVMSLFYIIALSTNAWCQTLKWLMGR